MGETTDKGWLDDGAGRLRWWDGEAWTDIYADALPEIPIPIATQDGELSKFDIESSAGSVGAPPAGRAPTPASGPARGKSVVRQKARVFFFKRRTTVIALAAALVVVSFVVGLAVKSSADEEARVVAVAEAKATAATEAREEAQRVKDLAVDDAEEAIATGLALYEESSAWSTQELRDALKIRIDAITGSLSSTAKDINSSVDDYETAAKSVGTQAEADARAKVAAEAAQDMQYAALVTANGKPGAAGRGRADCKLALDGAVYDVNDPSKLARYWLEYPYYRIDEAVQVYCPELQPSIDIARRSVKDGSRLVGSAIPSGLYRTEGAVSNCYWERNNGSGTILDNSFVTSALNGLEVTVNDGEGFTTRGCGIWTLVG